MSISKEFVDQLQDFGLTSWSRMKEEMVLVVRRSLLESLGMFQGLRLM